MGRHSLSTSHTRKTAVQQGRVSDLAKKRMGEMSAWASKAQKMCVFHPIQTVPAANVFSQC